METAEQQQKQKGPVLETTVKQPKTLSHETALDQSIVIAVCLLYLSVLVCVALLVGGWVFVFFLSFYGSLVDL